MGVIMVINILSRVFFFYTHTSRSRFQGPCFVMADDLGVNYLVVILEYHSFLLLMLLMLMQFSREW